MMALALNFLKLKRNEGIFNLTVQTMVQTLLHCQQT